MFELPAYPGRGIAVHLRLHHDACDPVAHADLVVINDDLATPSVRLPGSSVPLTA